MGEVEYVPRKTCLMDGSPSGSCEPFWEHYIRAPDHESHLGDFDVIYCRKCQTGFTQPYPTEETSGFLYEEKSSADFDKIQETVVDRFKDYLSRRLIRGFFKKENRASIRRVLDFGCGNARFAAAARDVFGGAEVDAVDFQEEPPPLLQDKRQFRLVYKTVSQFEGEKDPYDLILLRHVLEHTHRPVDLIRKLAERLQPQGVLYVEIPNLDSGCAKLFGKHWKGYYMPRHIFHYTAASLTAILAEAGLEGKVGRIEPPQMGNMIAILGGLKKGNRLVQVLGAFLHPVQLLTEALHGSSTCLNIQARKTASTVRL